MMRFRIHLQYLSRLILKILINLKAIPKVVKSLGGQYLGRD
jgi:hypothetical protein